MQKRRFCWNRKLENRASELTKLEKEYSVLKTNYESISSKHSFILDMRCIH